MNPLYPEIVPIRLHGASFLPAPRNPHGQVSRRRITDERRLRLGSIKLFTKILHRAPPHGTRYFSYLNRSLVVSRSKYFYPKESSHGRVRMKKQKFPGVWQPAAFVVVAFFRDTYGCFRGSRFATHMCYVVNNCNVGTRREISLPSWGRLLRRCQASLFLSHGMMKPGLRPRRSPG